ncbi:MAG: hypothetical protein HYV09_34800 [Deltaproteobacteria bacterium]|nr:hypothetical protein [Deltaproteobacteria bacterium]
MSESGGDDATDTGASTDDTGLVGDDTRPPEDSAPPPEAGDGGMIPGCGLDSDGDGIIDSIEGRGASGGDVDTDKDGTPDWKDLDSDDDGIPDIIEWAGAGCATSPFDDINDADGDGTPNFQDTDSDGNGLSDKDEVCPPAAVLTALAFPACDPGKPYDFDGDGTPDYLDFDNDHDSSKADKSIGLGDSKELSDDTGAYVGLVDTDKDGIPDLYDRDSDNDFILDLDDGLSDPDGDGVSAFRDVDSDGDKVLDACEARANGAPTTADYTKALLDTDGDGTPDFLDKDSDGDLLADGAEDKDGDCQADGTETDRLKADSDGDGVGDLVEVTLLGAAGAKDPAATPEKAGKFYFLEPWSSDGSAKPTPASSLLALSTMLNKGDVAFIVDTTGSMGGTISGLKSSLSTTIIPALKTRIPDLGVGIAAHDDFPYSSYGSASTGDKPFYFTTIPRGYVTTVTADSQAAANLLTTHYGGDGPESNVQAMYKALTGVALTWPGGSIAADAPPAGTFGAMRFRSDALPIVFNLTDITSHNGRRALDKTGTSYSGMEDVYSFSTYNVDQLVAKINELGARFIGGAADNGGRSTASMAPYGFLSYIADKTSSYAPPSAFTGGTCKTGVGGATIAADGPLVAGVRQCRLVFSFNSSGSGLATSVVDGVVALLNSIKFDVYVEAYNGTGETIDVVSSFMSKVEPQPTGGKDPVTGSTCVTFPSTQLADLRNTPKALAGAGDIAETIRQVNPGAYYCFAVVPKENTTIKPLSTPQTFRAWLKVLAVKPAGGTFALGTDREVLFIVPPVLN